MSALKINNCSTDYFDINRGVRKGDPFSPTLFNLYITDVLNLFPAHFCQSLTLESSVIGNLMFADFIFNFDTNNVRIKRKVSG